MRNKKLSIVYFILGIVMIVTGLLLWKESSFIIGGLGIVLIGISLMLYFNQTNI